MIEGLQKNIDLELQMVRELAQYFKNLDYAQTPTERALLLEAIRSLQARLKLINNSIPELLTHISIAPPLDVKKVPSATNLQKIQYQPSQSSSELTIIISKKDKDDYLHELKINEALIKKLKKRSTMPGEKYEEFKASRGYLKLSNRYFLKRSISLIQKGYFRPLAIDLKRGNIDILFETYVAMMFFTVFISMFVGIFLLVLLTFFSVGLFAPFLTFVGEDNVLRFFKFSWILIAVPAGTFLTLYFYPSTERSSIAKKIDQELPFAVIHMSAISGSGIEPSEIFKIIGLNKEYPFLKKEIRKVLNQINIYGYDLVTSLNNVAKTTPSQLLSELFAGLSTTISSGGDLKEFFEKRSESLLLGYRLEREKYTKLAETFMDIYISVVIAAPMILMLLLVMISVSGIDVGLPTAYLSFAIIGIIAVINIIFIAFLQIKQPRY